MDNDTQIAAIMSAGMKLLRENLGVIEMEIFLTKIGNNDFDYTKWRENLWEDLTPDELFARIAKTSGEYSPPEGVVVL